MAVLLTAAALSTLVLIITTALYRLIFHPLANVPGPKLAGLSTLWLAYHARKGRNHTFMPALHKKYGPIVRIAPNQVLVCSENAVHQIYSAGSPYVKGHWYQVCKAPGAKARGEDEFDLLTEKNKDRYRMQRRAIGPAYSIAGMEKHEALLDQHIEKFMACLERRKGVWIDLAEWMHIYALDGIASFTLGKSPNYMDTGRDGQNMVASDKHWAYFTVVGLFPWLVDLTQALPKTGMWLMIPIALCFGLAIPTGLPIFGFAVPLIMNRLLSLESTSEVTPPDDRPGLETSLKSKNAPMDSVADESTQDANEDEPDLLASLMKLHTAKEDRFRPSWVLGITLTNFGAGHDTTTLALSSTLYLILTHSPTKQRLLHELREAGITPSSSYHDIVQGVPYLLACMKEAQRLIPPLGIFMQRVVPLTGANMCGYHIPPGTNVGVHQSSIHQLSSVFPSPEKFQPERWMSDGSEERRKEIGRMDACWLGFGGGSRNCPGQHLGRFFVVKLLARLMVEFGEGVEVRGMPEFQGWFSVHMHGVDVRFGEGEKV